MLLLGVKTDNVTDYKKTSLLIAFPNCIGKCKGCQNQHLIDNPQNKEYLQVTADSIADFYNRLSTHNAIVMAGLEPLDSFNDVIDIIHSFGKIITRDTDIIIYSGYNTDEYEDKFKQDLINAFKAVTAVNDKIRCLIIKLGRYDEDCLVRDNKEWFNRHLGVKLATTNQYTIKYNADGSGTVERYANSIVPDKYKNKKERY